MSYYDIRNHATQKRSSSNCDMSFKQAFERDVNQQMEGNDPDRSQGEAEDSDIKKRPLSQSSTLVEGDLELAQKKDPPPRFSRIHDYGPAPAPVPVIIDRDPPRNEKRRGIFIPMPIFILLAILFFFMGTLLFVYTIIGLYNNRPAALLNFGGPQPAPIDSCNCADKGIHIAPNFVMGDQAKTVTTTVTVTPSAVAADAKTSSSSSSTSTKSKSTTTPTPSTKVVEVTPPPKLITSTSLLAVGPDGKPLPTTTEHSTKTVAPTISTAKPDANKEASIKSVLKSAKTALDITVGSSDLNPLTSDLPKPTSSKKDDKKDEKKSTKTKEKDAEATPCDPASLTDNCQH